MRKQVYVFGFDNTLVNSEDIIIQSTAEVLNINLTKDFWYKNLHSVTDVKTEMKILQDTFHVEYTTKLQNKVGGRFVEKLLKTAPNLPVFKLLNENIENSYILTGSPIEIVKMYLNAFSIKIPDKRLICGIYNGSGDKEKYLKKMQKESDVYYIDDDEALIKNASDFVTKVFLVKQPYNANALFQKI